MYNKNGFVPLKGTNGNFGIDKLKLHTEHFQVSDTLPWNIVPNTKKAGQLEADQTPLFVSSQYGEVVHGAKAYINTDKYSVTINNGRVYVDFNPSKFYHETDLTADPNRIADAMSYIQNDCKETHKLDLDIFSTGIGRLDITAQAEMNNLVPDYKDLISNGKRSMRFRPAEYPNGFLIGNTQRQVCTYDKGMKLQIDQQIKNAQPTNFQRLETRMLKSEATQRHTEFKYINHVLNGNISQLHSAYSKTISDVLSIGQSEINFIEMETLTGLIRNTIQNSSKRGQWFKLVIMVLNGNLPNPQQFQEALNRLYAEGVILRKQYYKMAKEYTELKHISDFQRGRYLEDTANSYADRYKEFTEKLILPYRTAL